MKRSIFLMMAVMIVAEVFLVAGSTQTIETMKSENFAHKMFMEVRCD